MCFEHFTQRLLVVIELFCLIMCLVKVEGAHEKVMFLSTLSFRWFSSQNVYHTDTRKKNAT